MKYSMKEKVLLGALSIVGIFTGAIEWPIYLVVAGARAAKHGNARKYFVCTLQYVGYGVAARAMYISAMVMALFNKEKSDEFYVEAQEYHKLLMAYLTIVTS